MDANVTNNNNLKKKELLPSNVLNSNIELRLACIEDGLDNVGFRKFSAYVKSIHSETKVAYIPTGNLRSVFRTLFKKGKDISKDISAGGLADKDIYKIQIDNDDNSKVERHFVINDKDEYDGLFIEWYQNEQKK